VAGQVLIGASLGTRFGPGFFARAPRLLAVTGGATVLGMALSAGFAGVLAAVSGLPWPTLVLATSPGGIAEMTLTAKTLQLGVPVVTTFHVVRSVVTLSALATVYRLLGRLRGWERDERDRRGATDAR
jgi:membrane AbrB-like protein